MANFTFKTEKSTGRYRSFYPDTVYIKHNKKVVGMFDEDFNIRLMIEKKDINENGNPNCSWKWITLKKKSSSLDEAKSFLKENYSKIVELYNLHYSDL